MTTRNENSFDWHDDGILWMINRNVFHPRGFALTRNRNPAEGESEWTMQGDGSEAWSFTEEMDDRGFAASEAFLRRLAEASTRITDSDA